MKYLLECLEAWPEFIRLSDAAQRRRGPVSVFGVSETQKVHLSSALASREGGRALLMVTSNDVQAMRLWEDYRALVDCPVHVFSPREDSLYAIAATSHDAQAQRLKILAGLLAGERMVVVASVEALQQRIMPPSLFAKRRIALQAGMRIDPEELVEQLLLCGYRREPSVEGPGLFSVRGGIVDIYPVESEQPCRVEFFDDEIDSIRVFDTLSQRSTDRVERVEIGPASEALVDDGVQAAERLEHALAVQQRRMKARNLPFPLADKLLPQLDSLRTYGVCEHLVAYLPLVMPSAATLMDYLPEGSLVCIDEPHRLKERADNLILEMGETLKSLLERGEGLPEQSRILLDYDALLAACGRWDMVIFQTLTRAAPGISPKAVFNLMTRGTASYHGQMDLVADDLRSYKDHGWQTLVMAGGHARGVRLEGEMRARGIETTFVDEITSPVLPGQIVIVPQGLSHGFEYPELRLAVVAAGDIFGAHRATANKPRRKPQGRQSLNLFVDLKPGDYIVHEGHGVGVYAGMERLQVDGKFRDYLLIRYREGDKLYVPTDQMDRVQKYIGGDEGAQPRLNRLGGADWNRTKQKAKASIRALAVDLVQLYAQREATKGFAYSKDTVWQRQFEESFPYEETSDQLTCIEQIKSDMEKPKPMDRLLCGDVGYGKTEVALRAAFKAVMDGKQVAFLVPTTILAQQHYNTIQQRMAGFPVACQVISRFRSPAEQKQILEQVRLGQVDILVGTHRLLGKDVRFKDLGLLIIDEEQRFGVGHKEQIKEMRRSVDVLTLSATPIPRTLHMSLVGIRDMSTLENPPEERYPVQTYVTEYQDPLVRDAILRELRRGGQAYVLYNTVRNIEQFAGRLSQLVPEARIRVGHGQMPEGVLENVMLDFMNHEFDVLVCSTIIESGLDIPLVNTMIVCDADRFGLSQLYQLRGRVGRSNRIAYAYFTFRANKVLSEVAERRLSAITEFTEFGSGFKIAMRDLEIRGAGNLLGAEQHGHMAAVGYDLYCKLMEQAIRELRGEVLGEELETKVELNLDAYLPDTYVRDGQQKIAMYQRIAAIATAFDRDDVVEELIDRYGDPPICVMNLVQVAYVKAMALKEHIDLITMKDRMLVLRFYEKAQVDVEGLLRAVQEHGDHVLLAATAPPRLMIRKKNADVSELLEMAEVFLEDLGKSHEPAQM